MGIVFLGENGLLGSAEERARLVRAWLKAKGDVSLLDVPE